MAIKYLWAHFIVCKNLYANLLLHFPINFSSRHYISSRRRLCSLLWVTFYKNREAYGNKSDLLLLLCGYTYATELVTKTPFIL